MCSGADDGSAAFTDCHRVKDTLIEPSLSTTIVSEIERLQATLIARNLLDGPASGELDEATLTALGVHIESLGTGYRFARPALTVAVLRSLEVME